MFDTLTEENFAQFAAKHYENPHCHGMDEFISDLNRFKYIKRLFCKYERTGDLKERLILNHIVVLYNVFGSQTTQMLFFKLEDHYSYLKPFLLLIDRLPREVVVGADKLHTDTIPLDQGIVDALRKI